MTSGPMCLIFKESAIVNVQAPHKERTHANKPVLNNNYPTLQWGTGSYSPVPSLRVERRSAERTRCDLHSHSFRSLPALYSNPERSISFISYFETSWERLRRVSTASQLEEAACLSTATTAFATSTGSTTFSILSFSAICVNSRGEPVVRNLARQSFSSFVSCAWRAQAPGILQQLTTVLYSSGPGNSRIPFLRCDSRDCELFVFFLWHPCRCKLVCCVFSLAVDCRILIWFHGTHTAAVLVTGGNLPVTGREPRYYPSPSRRWDPWLS